MGYPIKMLLVTHVSSFFLIKAVLFSQIYGQNVHSGAGAMWYYMLIFLWAQLPWHNMLIFVPWPCKSESKSN